MSEELLSPDLTLSLDAPQNIPVAGEWLLGTAAVVAQHQGDTDRAQLLAGVLSLEIRLWNTEWGAEGYKIVLVVAARDYPAYGESELEAIAEIMRAVLEPAGKQIDVLNVRPQVPRLGADWRNQVQVANGPKPTNQARSPRLEPRHPVEDKLHFTNEWEHDVYRVLKKRQAELPDNETIGIMPLGGM